MEPSEVRRRIIGYGSSASTLAGRQWRTMRTLDDWSQIVTRLTLMVQTNMIAAARFSAGEAVAAPQHAADLRRIRRELRQPDAEEHDGAVVIGHGGRHRFER